MSERLAHGGFPGVPQRFLDEPLRVVPGIEELAAALPESVKTRHPLPTEVKK